MHGTKHLLFEPFAPTTDGERYRNRQQSQLRTLVRWSRGGLLNFGDGLAALRSLSPRKCYSRSLGLCAKTGYPFVVSRYTSKSADKYDSHLPKNKLILVIKRAHRPTAFTFEPFLLLPKMIF